MKRPTSAFRTVVVLLGLGLELALITGCGDDGPGDFCHHLSSSADCDSSAESSCRTAVSNQLKSTPQCEKALNDLLDCAAKLPRVGCSGSSSAYATGDGKFSGNNFVDVGGANLVIADSSCTALKMAYDSCSN